MEVGLKKIYSNLRGFSDILANSELFRHIFIEDSKKEMSAWQIFIRAKNEDTVVLNIDHQKLLKLCALRYLFPAKRFKLVSVDIILRKPFTPTQKILAYIKATLLKKVDIFILYFKNVDNYEKYFGISKEKIRYVPFKVNSWAEFSTYVADPLNGDYVLCAGQTMRDLKTYIEAIKIVGLPAVLLTPGEMPMNKHGTQLITEGLPANLRLVIDNSGKEEVFLNWIKNAAIVVIPRYSFDIAPSGISTYLCAMAAWRCVILSKGPGSQDLLTDGQAVLVEPENVAQLADAILLAWNDINLRKRVAIQGRRYANQLKGKTRLLSDILKTLNT